MLVKPLNTVFTAAIPAVPAREASESCPSTLPPNKITQPPPGYVAVQITFSACLAVTSTGEFNVTITVATAASGSQITTINPSFTGVLQTLACGPSTTYTTYVPQT